MRIYFVRHGLTLCNEREQIQGMEDELAPKGLLQAGILAERLAKIPFTSLLSSDMRRAVQTAEIISKRTGHTFITSPLFREIMYPSSLVGKNFAVPEALAYQDARRAEDSPDWRFEDEETLAELRARAKDAFVFAASQEADVVIVTHGRFLRTIIFSHLFEEPLTTRQEMSALERFYSSNTGITVFEKHKGVWKFLTWNDHAHLG